MTGSFKIAIAQLNPTVGKIEHNLTLARRALADASNLGADLLVLSELFLIGYPPEDLVLKQAFIEDAIDALHQLAQATSKDGPGILVGTPWPESGGLMNAAALLSDGKLGGIVSKVHLPNYGVFDELRVFRAGQMPGPLNFRGVRFGVMVCEDAWFEDVSECLQETGAEILIVLNGSPFSITKYDERIQQAVSRVGETRLPLVYVNQVGGQDELVFDGASFAINSNFELVAQLPAWEEAVELTEWRREEAGWQGRTASRAILENAEEMAYLAAVTGVRDYVEKNGFPGVVLGMSGGVDSALTAAIAVDALGPQRVRCVMLPSRYTSKASIEDAQACATALQARYEVVPIETAVHAFAELLKPIFAERPADTTEENIQSRIRAVLLMAMSNKFGEMLLTTGNKSEMSVGYATLYGDMCGGYNPLKDLYKTRVFELSAWRNAHLPKGALGPASPVIPQNIIDKPPSAELRADQTDQDSLPPYDILDDILFCLVEEDMGYDDVVARGHEPETVRRIEHLLYVAEYKRRQAPPGVKIGVRHFGRDRRYPITNGYRDAR